MPVSIPKKPKTQVSVGAAEVNPQLNPDDIQVRRSSVGEAEITPKNGGQPLAEDVEGNPADPVGPPSPAEQAYRSRPGNEQPDPIEPSMFQPTDIADLGKLGAGAAAILAGKVLGTKAMKTAAEKLLPRIGQEGLTGLRDAQAAVKAGKLAPEELAAYARKLLGDKEAPVVTQGPAWQASSRTVANNLEDKMSKAWWEEGKLTEGRGAARPGDFAGGAKSKNALVQDNQKWPGPATNAGARAQGQVPITPPPESPVVGQFVKAAGDWLTGEFPQIVTQSMSRGVK